jgi:hypothetical protein
VPADETYDVPEALRRVPEGWPALPGTGQPYEERFVVPDGARLAAPPAMPWPGSVAVFRVTGDPADVVEAAVPRGASRRTSQRTQGGADITSVIDFAPSPYGSVTAEVVDRPGRPPLLLVEHDATD